MELSTRIYYYHPDQEIMAQLKTLFTEVHGDEARFISMAQALNVELGQDLAQGLIDSVDSLEYDVDAEALETIAGYHVCYFTHGSDGDECIAQILFFLKSLIPDLHVQAWGCGDEDPWEFWYKFEGDDLLREDDEPLNDPDEDEEIKASIYAWWHEGLPSEIRVGYLNESEEEEEE